MSNLAITNISVIQGSILGPILFLCYINDLPSITKLLTILFADDTCGLAKSKNLPDLINFCNTELNKIAIWMSANKLAVNVSKCKFIIFHHRNKKINLDNLSISLNYNEDGNTSLTCNIYPLERIHNNNPNKDDRTYKYLGILLDENLTFNSHVDSICNKLSRGIFSLRRAKPYLSLKALRTLYFSLVHCHLQYCSTIINCTSHKNIKRIFTLQKKAIRLIANAPYNAHTTPLFIQLKILPFDKIITKNILLFMHSIKFGYAPHSFSSTWITNPNRNLERNLNHNLRAEDDFYVQPQKYDSLKNLPLYSFPREWNNLGDMRFQPNPTTFKIWLQGELFDQLSLLA